MSQLKAVPTACRIPHRAALEAVRCELKTRFLERSDIVDGLLAALLCREHVLLLGPPGTAKSALAAALTQAIVPATHFSWLLTKFSTPEEIFGPVSLAALQQDRVARITTGKLPEAHIGFLDEIFKANSAILNSLLSTINERIFHNDGKAIACPLLTMVGASNELPEGEELEALFDRFLVRFWVPYIQNMSAVRSLLTSAPPVAQSVISLDDLAICQAEAERVIVPDPVIDAVLAIKHRTEEQGFRASDRRWKQAIGLLKARAYLEGEDVAAEDHLDVLADVLWREPKDRPALAAIIGKIGNPLNVRATEIQDAAAEAVRALGNGDPKNATARADWLKEASLVESRLSDMNTELDELIRQNPKRNLSRVKEATRAVQSLKTELTRTVAHVYGL
jgi:MoxR-like ATPase